MRRVSAVLADSLGPTQWESEARFSVSRGSRLIEPVGPAPVAAVSGSLHDSESDTESVPATDRWTHRRLNLVWKANSPDSVPVQNHADAPDRHDQRLFRVRRANANGASGSAHARGAAVHSRRLRGDGHCQCAGRVPLQGAMFARCTQFLAWPVQIGFGHQLGRFATQVIMP